MNKHYSILIRLHTYYPLVIGSVHASAVDLNSMGSIYKHRPWALIAFIHRYLCITSQVPIYTPAWVERGNCVLSILPKGTEVLRRHGTLLTKLSTRMSCTGCKQAVPQVRVHTDS